MDPFEEFEFKPLTDGLGFHKNNTAGAKLSKEEETFTSKKFIKDQGLTLLDEVNSNPLSTPLPRKNSPVSSKMSFKSDSFNLNEMQVDSTTTAVDDILKNLQQNRQFNFEEETQRTKPSLPQVPTATKIKNAPQTTLYKPIAKPTTAKISPTTPKEEYKESVLNLTSGILDSMLILASSILCLIILLIVTKADLVSNMTHPDEAGMIYISTFSVFATVSFIYLTVNRIFLGQTPGEWTFDQRVGTIAELNTNAFGLKIVARSALIILTGFITLPILSLLLNKDIAGRITGAKMFKKV